MDATQFIFIVTAALIVASAVMVVTTRNLVHAALWLIAALFGVAVIFILLEAGFLAVVQVVVYIGAIAIMFIFAVMLTRATWPPSSQKEKRPARDKRQRRLLRLAGTTLAACAGRQCWEGSLASSCCGGRPKGAAHGLARGTQRWPGPAETR